MQMKEKILPRIRRRGLMGNTLVDILLWALFFLVMAAGIYFLIQRGT